MVVLIYNLGIPTLTPPHSTSNPSQNKGYKHSCNLQSTLLSCHFHLAMLLSSDTPYKLTDKTTAACTTSCWACSLEHLTASPVPRTGRLRWWRMSTE